MTRPRIELADLPSTEAEIHRRSFGFNRRPGARNNRGRIPEYDGNGPNFAALGAAFWIDASNPASYAASGGNLTSIKSLISGAALSTIVGVPKIITDLRDGKPAFQFAGASAPAYVMGTDATYAAAAAGTNKPFCSIEVVEPDVAGANGVFVSAADSGSGQSQSHGQLAGPFGVYRVGTIGYVQSATETSVAGLDIVVRHSADGLTIKTSVNGGAESQSTITSAGAITVNRIGVGASVVNAIVLPYGGTTREFVYFGADQTPADIAAWVAALKRKWPSGPQVMCIGDSISTAQLATNGGMVALLASAVLAAGGRIDMQGPIELANGSGGQVWWPHRASASSGNTCTQLNARVSSTTDGLGLGGGSIGAYRRTKLVCLMAGTNMETDAPTTLAAYATLLSNCRTRLQQSDPTACTAVTTICEISANRAYSQDFNAGLPALWNASDAAFPGVPPLIRWNAALANPNDDSNTYFYDGTHPNDAGYVRLCNDATYGLIQAVKPYLMSIQ